MGDAPGRGTPDLTALLLTTKSLEGFLTALAEAAMALAPHSAGCAITLERRGRPLTVASVGARALELDERQYGQDDGPCLEALRTGHEVSVPDMLDEGRWGSYPAYAVAMGTHSSMSFPIAPRTHTAGALNLYADRVRGFADADLPALRSVASQATGAIALAQRVADIEGFNGELQDALRSRAVIDQAMGVIMAQQRCTHQEAFDILRSASQHRNIKIRDLCAELISRFGEPSDPPDLPPRT
ncbi:GAF and ANTAR domain-containing protein [Actinacidiphila paucisporea]|uniref:GAF domain-containing protein n=1 Tax=Actinacidiphila paucisporea TaxID=310782 RepID=A0A1M7LP65_9ACTN|nr:GAF and ANTAR domain-containing protein [Actinacidiphila paucisporea]SHM79428.1 GAF domain-containing protein [Actinacidiphila paucisporea]